MKAESLKKHAAEFLTVFLGVILAFLAEDWREYRGDRAEEAQVLESLAGDFVENREERDIRMAWQTKATANLIELDAQLASAPIGSVVPISDTLLTATLYAATYDPARGIVDALLSSGRLGIIRDADLRAAIAEWPSYVDDAAEDQSEQRQHVDEAIVPYFLEHDLPMRHLIVGHLDWARGEASDEFNSGSVPIRVTEDLRTLISMRVFISRLASADLRSLARHAGDIEQMLGVGPAPTP